MPAAHFLGPRAQENAPREGSPLTRLVPCKNSPSVPGRVWWGAASSGEPLPHRVVPAIAFRRDLSDIRHPAQREAALESVRGDIRRTERAELDSDAQGLQHFLDRLLYSMAGLGRGGAGASKNVSQRCSEIVTADRSLSRPDSPRVRRQPTRRSLFLGDILTFGRPGTRRQHRLSREASAVSP